MAVVALTYRRIIKSTMRLSTCALAVIACSLAWATPAQADATAFLGTSSNPVNRPVYGFALGGGLLVLGFEFEYAETSDNLAESAPSLKTGMGNVLLQTPFAIAGFQLYGTAGAGPYRERLGEETETHIGLNTGGGVKMSLVGPLRVRLDYRVFSLKGEPRHSVVQRFYAGVNLDF